MSKKLLYQVKEKEIYYDDDTVVFSSKTIKDKKIDSKSKSITTDKLKRKASKERVVKNIIERTKYFYDNNTQLITEKHYRVTPKKQEKKLEKDLVVQVS